MCGFLSSSSHSAHFRLTPGAECLGTRAGGDVSICSAIRSASRSNGSSVCPISSLGCIGPNLSFGVTLMVDGPEEEIWEFGLGSTWFGSFQFEPPPGYVLCWHRRHPGPMPDKETGWTILGSYRYLFSLALNCARREWSRCGISNGWRLPTPFLVSLWRFSLQS